MAGGARVVKRGRSGLGAGGCAPSPPDPEAAQPPPDNRQPGGPDEALGDHGEHEQQAGHGEDEARNDELDERVADEFIAEVDVDRIEAGQRSDPESASGSAGRWPVVPAGVGSTGGRRTGDRRLRG